MIVPTHLLTRQALERFRRTTMDIPCITRKYHGGLETITYDDWACNVIQELGVARDVAKRMLDHPTEAYEWNEDDPEFYETFTIANLEVFRREFERANVRVVMSDVSNLTSAGQVAYAHGNTESLNTHTGYSTDALQILSMDTSWLNDEGGSATEPPGLWYARIGRYILTCNSQGSYESREFETPDQAAKFFEDIPATIGET